MIVSVNPSVRNQSGKDIVRQTDIYSKQKGRNLQQILLKYLQCTLVTHREFFPQKVLHFKFSGQLLLVAIT